MSTKQNFKCHGCDTSIGNKKQILCTNSKCKKQYHCSCVNMKNANPELLKTWLCPECQCTMKKGGDNSSTPVQSSPSIQIVPEKKQRAANSTQVSVLDSPSETDSPLCTLTEEIRLLRHEILQMKSDFDTAIAAVRRCEGRLDEATAAMSAFDSRLKPIEANVAEVVEIKQVTERVKMQIESLSLTMSGYETRLQLAEGISADNGESKELEGLRIQVNGQAQAMLRNHLEISGIPEKVTENPYHLFLTLAAVAGSNISDIDIDFVARAGAPKRDKTSHPRPLVVRFCRQGKRDEFYKNAKLRSLTTADINLEGPATKIYVNERLTRENRMLFHECRTQFKAAGYKYCWTNHGQILVKKREGKGEDAKVTVIGSYRQIIEILGQQEKNQ